MRRILFGSGFVFFVLILLAGSIAPVSAATHLASSGSILVATATVDPNNGAQTSSYFWGNKLLYQYECDNYQGKYAGVFPYTGACYFYPLTVTFTTQHPDSRNTNASLMPGDTVTVHVVADPTGIASSSPHLCPNVSGDPGQTYQTSGCAPNTSTVGGIPSVSRFAQWAFFKYTDQSGDHKTGLCPGNPSYRPYPYVDAYTCTGNGAHLEGVVDETWTITIPSTASQVCGGYDGDGAHVFTSFCEPVIAGKPMITAQTSPGTYGDGVQISAIQETLVDGSPISASLAAAFGTHMLPIVNGATHIGALGDPTGVIDAGTYSIGIWDTEKAGVSHSLSVTIGQAPSQIAIDTSQPGIAQILVNPAIGVPTATAKGMRMPTGNVSVSGPNGPETVPIGGTYTLPTGFSGSYSLSAYYPGDQDYAPSSTNGTGAGTGGPTGGMTSSPHEYGTTNGYGVVSINAVCDKPPPPPPPTETCVNTPDGSQRCWWTYYPPPPCHAPGGTIVFTSAYGSASSGYSSSVTFQIPPRPQYPHVGTYADQACYSGDDQHSGLCVTGTFTIIPAHAQINAESTPAPDTIGVPSVPLQVSMTTDTVPLQEGTISFTTTNCSQGPCNIVITQQPGASAITYNWTPLPPQQPGTLVVAVTGEAQDYIFDTAAYIPVTIYPAHAEIDNPVGMTVYNTPTAVVSGRYGTPTVLNWTLQSFYWDPTHTKQYLTDIPEPDGTLTLSMSYTSWTGVDTSQSQVVIAVTHGSAQYTFPATTSAGTYQITIGYSGDVYHYAEGSTLQVDILPQTSAMVLSGPTTSVYGHSVPLGVTVQLPAFAIAEGTVILTVDDVAVQTWPLTADTQTFTVLLQGYDAGAHAVLWTFDGSNDAMGVGASQPLTITPAPTQTALTSSLNPSYDGQLLVFTPFVAPSEQLESWAIPITGLVGFSNGTTYIGATQYPAPFKEWSQVGSTQVTAAYRGALDYQPSAGMVVQIGLHPGSIGNGSSMRAFVADAGGPIDLAIDGHTVATNIQYDTLVPYFGLTPGDHVVTALRSSTQTVIVSQTLTWQINEFKTVMITGPANAESIVGITDDLTVSPTGGRVRVYDAVWTEPAILLGDTGASTLEKDVMSYDTASQYVIESVEYITISASGNTTYYQQSVSFTAQGNGLYSIFLLPNAATVTGGSNSPTSPPLAFLPPPEWNVVVFVASMLLGVAILIWWFEHDDPIEETEFIEDTYTEIRQTEE